MAKRGLPVAALVAAFSLLAGGASASHAGKGVTTFGEIEALSMDGPLVAYDIGARENIPAGCNRVLVWNVKTGVKKKVSGRRTCDADSTSTGSGVAELAVAGKRVAWITNEGGNTESIDSLYVSSSRKPHERRLARADREGDVGGPDMTGGWIGGLAGSGKLLVVNQWTTAAGVVTKAKLQRIRTHPSKIASGADTLTARSVAGRIAVVRGSGDVTVYSSGGHVVRTVSPGALRDVALEKTRLFVLTQANKLEVYGIKTGKLLHAWHAKGKWAKPGRVGSDTRLGAYKNVAVYSVRNKVYALDLSTGKNAVVVKAPRTLEAPIAAPPRLALEKPGLVYAYDSFSHKSLTVHGHVAFVRMAKVRARIR